VQAGGAEWHEGERGGGREAEGMGHAGGWGGGAAGSNQVPRPSRGGPVRDDREDSRVSDLERKKCGTVAPAAARPPVHSSGVGAASTRSETRSRIRS
jgi:hypothetical protein